MAAETNEYTLGKQQELRVVVADSGTCTVKLLEGEAEVFGSELVENKGYVFQPGSKFAVGSWSGASIQVTGALNAEMPPTVSGETAMVSAVAIHQRLEARRQAAAAAGSTYGPRVMLAGPTDVGKSTLLRTLASYAVRLGWAPTVVDLDLGQGDVLTPGSVVAAPVDLKCVDVTAPWGFEGYTPLAYFTGTANPSSAVPVWENHVKQVARGVNARMAQDATARASGLFVNTAGWVEKAGYAMLLHAARELRVDIVLVLGQESLVTRLKGSKGGLGSLVLPPLPTPAAPSAAQPAAAHGAKSPSPPPAPASGEGAAEEEGTAEDGGWPAVDALPPVPHSAAVVYVKRSQGVVVRSSGLRRSARDVRLQRYFYGVDGSKQPATLTVPLADISVVSVGGTTLSADVLPVGGESLLSALRVTELSGSEVSGLVDYVLGVSFAPTLKAVPHTNVAGFVVVVGVDEVAGTVSLLCPNSAPLPGKVLIKGDVKWVQ